MAALPFVRQRLQIGRVNLKLQSFTGILKAYTSKTQTVVIFTEAIIYRRAPSVIVADPSLDLVSTLQKTTVSWEDFFVLPGGTMTVSCVGGSQCLHHAGFFFHSLCHLGLLGGIRAVLPESWKNKHWWASQRTAHIFLLQNRILSVSVMGENHLCAY